MASEIKPVTPEQAAKLLEQGALYVDVRSEPEFEQGHVPRALNVPLMHKAAAGMTANPEFSQVMQTAFAKDEKLIIGCKSGGRSRRAAEMLANVGFCDISELSAGFDGSRDAFGRLIAGWSKQNLPIETGNPAGQTYVDVKSRKPPRSGDE